jgi:hypothetical protein
MNCFDRDTGDRSPTIWDVRYLSRTAWRSTACAGESIGYQFGMASAVQQERRRVLPVPFISARDLTGPA